MDSLGNIKKSLDLHNKKNNNTEETSKPNTEETSKPNTSQKTFWNNHSWWIPLPIFSILSIVIILLVLHIQIPFFHCPEGYTLNQTEILTSSVPIKIDSSKYAIGQIVHINSNITNNNDSPEKETYLEINRTHVPSMAPGCFTPLNQTKISTFALIKLDEGWSNYTYIPNQPGLYIINTYNTSQQHEFKTIFEVINPLRSTSFILLIIAIGFFIALVMLTFILSRKNKILNDKKIEDKELKKIKENYQKEIKPIKEKYQNEIKKIKENYQNEIKMIDESYQNEIKPIDESYQNEIKPIEESYQRNMYDYIEIAGSIRFFFISALVWSIIIALVFNEVEIGTHSPLGLVIRHNLNPQGGELDVTKNPLIDWGINIGGSWENNFSSGVIIPVYVFILGFIGGYLRYLQKTTSKEKIKEEKTKEEYKTSELPTEFTSLESQKIKYKPIESTSLDFQENTYGELSHIFLAPLLAAVVWFIISRGEPESNIYGMAAVSFSIGLVTTEIIQIIVKFMERIVPSAKNT